MKQAMVVIILLVLITSFNSGSAIALEALSQGQMKHAVAQAGVSIAITDLNTEIYSGLKFSNPDDSTQYINFEELHILSHVDTAPSDKNDDGLINHLTIDVGSINNLVMLNIKNNDLSIISDMTIGNIDFCGTSIGSLSAQSMETSMLNFDMGPHTGSAGIDYQMGQRFSIDSLSYHYNTNDALSFTGITFANSFTGPLITPANWSPVGAFQLGDILNNRPATFDITVDHQESLTMTDSNGDTYTISNPRYDSTYIALSMPMSGSIRINNISNITNFGGSNQGITDLGLLAIDGIDVQKLNIEIPGRGLGKP